MTVTLTQHDTTRPNTLLRWQIAVLDTGSRTTQWITPTGLVMTIPTVIKIRGKLHTKWGQYFSEIGEVLIIGGSAPQTISIRGMMV
ncbi:MAG: hypothetical protein ACYTXT_36815 [Nostoc sp.]